MAWPYWSGDSARESYEAHCGLFRPIGTSVAIACVARRGGRENHKVGTDFGRDQLHDVVQRDGGELSIVLRRAGHGADRRGDRNQQFDSQHRLSDELHQCADQLSDHLRPVFAVAIGQGFANLNSGDVVSLSRYARRRWDVTRFTSGHTTFSRDCSEFVHHTDL